MKKKKSSPCVKSHQNQIHSIQFCFFKSDLTSKNFFERPGPGHHELIHWFYKCDPVVVVEGPQKMVIFKVWSEKKNSFKKRSRYLLWAILELRALCEGAAAAKSETKNLSTCRIVTKANTLGVISFQWWFFMLNRGTHLRHQGALFGLVVKI